jgi:hypothetical protein
VSSGVPTKLIRSGTEMALISARSRSFGSFLKREVVRLRMGQRWWDIGTRFAFCLPGVGRARHAGVEDGDLHEHRRRLRRHIQARD